MEGLDLLSPSTHLVQNLEALTTVNPVLAERLRWPVGSDHVRQDSEGSYYRVNLGEVRLDIEQANAELIASRAPAEGPCLVFGIGLGEIVAALLRRGTNRVLAWDRDPWLLRLALDRYDFSAFIQSERLSLGLSADLITLAEDFPVPSESMIVGHPVLARIYHRELRLFRSASTGPLALVGDGGLLVDDLVHALQSEGYRVFTVDLQLLSIEELGWTVDHFHPKLIATVNYTEGLGDFATQHNVPLLCWEIDPTDGELRPLTSGADHLHIFTYRRANVETFRAAGFSQVEYLPIAADPETRRPLPLTEDDRSKFGSKVSFVGSSLVQERESYERKYYLLVEHFRVGTPEWAQSLLAAALTEQAQDWSVYRVPSSFDELAPQLPPHIRKTLGHCAGEIASAQRRREYISRLLPVGIKVWGDPGWAVAAGEAYRGPAGHFGDLNRIYCGSTVNLDVNRLYQTDIVPMRIFDVLATGSFVLAEYSPTLEELFEVGVEVDCYRTADEMEQKVRHYLAHPDRAAAIASRGRSAVLERHTVRQRVRHMLAQLDSSCSH